MGEKRLGHSLAADLVSSREHFLASVLAETGA